MSSTPSDSGGPADNGSRRSRRLSRYAPFLAVAVGVAVLIAVLPSRAPERDKPDAPSVGVPGANADGDRSHCTDDDRQFGVTVGWGVPCVPKFEGDNGGATADGVTAETVDVVMFEALPSEEADAILGVAAEQRARREKAIVAYVDFVNSHFEMYGRRIELTRVEGDCPTTPPDYDRCLAAAQEVAGRRAPAAGRVAVPRRPGPGGRRHLAGLRHLPGGRPAARRAGRQPVGRRAADAGVGHGVHGHAPAGADRRAVAGAGAGGGRPAARDRPPDAGGRHHGPARRAVVERGSGGRGAGLLPREG